MRYSESVIKSMRENYVGRRVRLVKTNDPYTMLKSGDEGIINHVDSWGTVFVQWDNGSSLGMVKDAGDEFMFIDE